MSKAVFPCAGTTRLLPAICLSLLGAIALLPPSVPTAGAAGAVVSQAWIPLTGTVFDPQTSTPARLVGDLHVVTRVAFTPANIVVTIHANLATGDEVWVDPNQNQCNLAVVPGASSVAIAYPPGPIFPPTAVNPVFQNFLLFAVPPNPCFTPSPIAPAPVPFSIGLQLNFAGDGSLNQEGNSAVILTSD